MFVIIIKWSSNYNYKNFRWQPRQEADSQLSITSRINEVPSPPENFLSKRIGNPMSFRAGKSEQSWRNLQS